MENSKEHTMVITAVSCFYDTTSAEDLQRLSEIESQSKLAEFVDLALLSELSLNRAHEVIQEITLSKRIKILRDLDRHLLSLYEVSSRFGNEKNLDPADRITEKDYFKILGKIKHLEIMQTWLFGIEV